MVKGAILLSTPGIEPQDKQEIQKKCWFRTREVLFIERCLAR